MFYHLQTKQLIKSDLDTLWEFMSSPKNLSRITPDHMQFEILSDLGDGKMYPGQIIEYHVRPLFNIQLHWVTEITHVKEKEFFVDEQRSGPYKFWHHLHRFIEKQDGVLMEDILHYELPYGPIGGLAHQLFIRKNIEKIFQYRHQQLEQIFNIGKK